MRITVEELLQRYAAGERDFSSTTLKRIDLSGANLPPPNLQLANFLQILKFLRDIRNVNFLLVRFFVRLN